MSLRFIVIDIVDTRFIVICIIVPRLIVMIVTNANDFHPREDAGGLGREYVLHISSVS